MIIFIYIKLVVEGVTGMLESIKIFISAAQRGSINAAAEANFITPPAALKRLNSLEDELGLKLLERSGRGVTLTRAGQSYLADAIALVSLSEQATARARRAEAGTCVIRAGTSVLNPCNSLVELWKECGENFPQYSIEIVPFTDSVAELSEIYARMGARFDVMMGIYDYTAPRKPFCMLPVGQSAFCICMPAAHRLSGQSTVKIEDLRGERVIIVRQGMSPKVDRLRAQMSAYLDISLIDAPEFYDIGVFNRVAAEGVLLLSVEYWAHVHPSVVSVPLEGAEGQAYGIAYAHNAPAGVQRFVSVIASYLSRGRKP